MPLQEPGRKVTMTDEKCGGPGCRKKVDMLGAWAIRDGKYFCGKDCYMKYLERTDVELYKMLSTRSFA